MPYNRFFAGHELSNVNGERRKSIIEKNRHFQCFCSQYYSRFRASWILQLIRCEDQASYRKQVLRLDGPRKSSFGICFPYHTQKGKLQYYAQSSLGDVLGIKKNHNWNRIEHRIFKKFQLGFLFKIEIRSEFEYWYIGRQNNSFISDPASEWLLQNCKRQSNGIQ